jgi:hypothetical protein
MSRLQAIAKKLPPAVARMGKRVAVYPRFWRQRARCHRAIHEFGDRYGQKILFVAGLPKSGTTWLEQMLSSFPGIYEALIPEVAAYELKTGGSHDYELPDDIFQRLTGMLVLTKMHVHGSKHNVEVLKQSSIRHVVLYRDLRDVAVSEYFYVRQTPWHPMHPHYRTIGVKDGLMLFAERTLPGYISWVRSWHANHDKELSLEVRYESLVADPAGQLTRIASHLLMQHTPKLIASIVDAHSFTRLSGGRERGQTSEQSFFRSGTTGDWRNHFDETVTAAYKSALGEFLIEFGYEQNTNW